MCLADCSLGTRPASKSLSPLLTRATLSKRNYTETRNEEQRYANTGSVRLCSPLPSRLMQPVEFLRHGNSSQDATRSICLAQEDREMRP